MRFHARRWAAGVLGVCLASSGAQAEVISEMILPRDAGYGPRNDPIRGVLTNDTVNFSLHMYNASFGTASINTLGEVTIPRGPAFTDMGLNRNGTGRIQGTWDEVIQGNNLYINTVIKTSNGQQFVPGTAMVGGSPAAFWTWHFGTANGVDFFPWVTSVTLVTARAYMSSDGGQTFFNSAGIMPGMESSWNPGRDPGTLMSSVADGTNYMLFQYQIVVVPAPSGLGVMAGGLLAATRRRRR